MKDGKCISDFFWTGPVAEIMYSVFAISTFFTFYFIPAVCFFILYGAVVVTMQRRRNDSNFQTNR